MKSNLHPTWYPQATVTCACGASFVTGASQDSYNVDICSKCHPFFTGEMKFVDRQGRVDKFMQKMQAAQSHQASTKNKPKKSTKSDKDQQSYRQILQEQKQTLKQAPAAK
jgi:large subunit ribosomal protein L31